MINLCYGMNYLKMLAIMENEFRCLKPRCKSYIEIPKEQRKFFRYNEGELVLICPECGSLNLVSRTKDNEFDRLIPPVYELQKAYKLG